MDIKSIQDGKFFLDTEGITARYKQGIYPASVAIAEYMIGKTKNGRECYEKLKRIADKLGMEYDTAKSAVQRLRKKGILYQDKHKSEVEITGRKSYQRLWHWGEEKDNAKDTEKVLKQNGNETHLFDIYDQNEAHRIEVSERTPERLRNAPVEGNETQPHTREEYNKRNIYKNDLSEEEAPQDSSSDDFLSVNTKGRAPEMWSYDDTPSHPRVKTYQGIIHPISTPAQMADWYYQCLIYLGHEAYDNREEDKFFSKYLLKFMRLTNMDEQQVRDYLVKYINIIPKRKGSHYNLTEFTVFVKNEEAKRTGNCWIGKKKYCLNEVSKDRAEKYKYDLDDCLKNCQVKLPERYRYHIKD